MYEGEVDCDTWGDSRPTPLGYGRLLLQDTVRNTALNSYVGYFDGSMQPSIYQYDRVLFREHYDRPDNLMMLEKKVDDGSTSSYYNTNGKSDPETHNCMRFEFDVSTGVGDMLDGHEECYFNGYV